MSNQDKTRYKGDITRQKTIYDRKTTSSNNISVHGVAWRKFMLVYDVEGSNSIRKHFFWMLGFSDLFYM
jgi:hypothetical protein